MQKTNFTWKTLLRCILVFCALFQVIGFSPVTAQSTESDQDLSIYLVQGTFDPLQSIPKIPESLTYSPAEVEANGVYIVQFEGPIQDAWKEQISRAGGQLGPYLPNYAFLAKLDPAARNAVSAMPEVRWIGPYEAAYKLAEHVSPTDTRTYRVLVAPWASEERTAQAMSTFAARPVVKLTVPEQVEGVDLQSLDAGRGEKILAVDLDGAGLEQAARLGDVLWIEPVYLNKLHNNIGGAIMGRATSWAAGYTGTGQAINVTDSGLDTGAAGTVHVDFRTHITNIVSWPVAPADYGSGCVIQNAGANDGASDGNGHGTHVTGSVAGNGAASSGAITGIAPNAVVNFQAIEQWTDFPSNCSIPDGAYLTGIPINLAPMFQQAYNWGARVQNESWGGGNYGEYDDQAAQFDSFISSHPDFAVFVAAGNSGTDDDFDGYVDLNSISSPATAKNVITIGASDNVRETGGLQDPYWLLWDNFFWGPTGDDYPSDNAMELAAFSSRGPMNDNRIKPDLVAPGTNILSTRSSLEATGGWGAYNSYYHFMGGTSMASPLAAGAGTLVRQYYQTYEKVPAPSAALIKATLINTATDITGYGDPTQEAGQPIPNMHEGWGRINVGEATTSGRKFVDQSTGLTTGVTHTYYYNVGPGKPFKVSLAWSDKPAAALASVTLVNNLSLRVTAPNGTTTYLGNVFNNGWSTTGGTFDNRNNLENVYIQSPTPGPWKVEVIGQNVPSGPQNYALVLGGNFSVAPAAFAKASPANGATIPTTSTTLTWAASIGATSYEYCIDTSNNATCNATWVSTGTARTKALTGLALGTTYYWQARSRNAIGVTEASGGWWSFTPQPPAPAAFNKSFPLNGATIPTQQITLGWAASTYATSYEYCFDTTNNATCDGTWTSTGTANKVFIQGLSDSTTYYWHVRAKNTGGTTYSNTDAMWSFTIDVIPLPFKNFLPSAIQ